MFFLANGPDPLRVPEVIIVLCVLLLWCISIFIFIRHSEILRIRHRDLPFRSTIKPPIDSNHITVVTCSNDTVIHSKSCVSSIGGLTPPIGNHVMNRCRHDETIETISLSISPISRKRRHKSASPSIAKHSFDKHDDKEQLFIPSRVSIDIKQDMIDLDRKTIGNLRRKSMNHLSSVKYPIFSSTNDVTNRRQEDNDHLIVKKRYVQESPV